MRNFAVLWVILLCITLVNGNRYKDRKLAKRISRYNKNCLNLGYSSTIGCPSTDVGNVGRGLQRKCKRLEKALKKRHGYSCTGVQYKVTYSIMDDEYAKSKSMQYVKVKGSKGETTENLCVADFNVINQDVLCTFYSEVNIGDYRCVCLTTGGNDGLDLTRVKVEIDSTETHTITETMALDNKDTLTFCKGGYQIGEDIEGEAAGDNFGLTVSLSADGTVLAVGAPANDGNGNQAGHVRVFSREGDNWAQVGEDINGEAAEDRFGNSVSLSGDGTILAAGAPLNDANGQMSGHVRVYSRESDRWVQIGENIDGEAAGDYFGSSLSLNADGTVLAVGGPGNDGNGNYAGHVRVFSREGDNWAQIGEDIDGEAAGVSFGSSLSLSGEGTVLAVGAPLTHVKGNHDGQVRVYSREGNNWVQIGQNIDGEAAGDEFGKSLSLCASGTILAVGAPLNDANGQNAGHVRVYSREGDNWVQIGQDIDGEASLGKFGYSVSLRADGAILAVGNGHQSGPVRVYSREGNWKQIGRDFDGENAGDYSGWSVSLSGDGATLAIGARMNGGKGDTRVFYISTY